MIWGPTYGIKHFFSCNNNVYFHLVFSEYIFLKQTEVITHRLGVPLDENEDIHVHC